MIHSKLLSIKNSKATLKEKFKNSKDLIQIQFNLYSGERALIVYIQGLNDKETINRAIITPLVTNSNNVNDNNIRNLNDITSLISIANSKIVSSYSEATNEILYGMSALIIEGLDGILILDSNKTEKRAVAESQNESVVRGPKQCFIENIDTNISMIRKIVRNSNLTFEYLELGSETKTKIAISYICGSARSEVVDEVKNRLSNIKITSVLESGNIERYIEDSPVSIFPTIFNSEKPDVVAKKLLDGKVAIFCDGTPHVLTVPTLLIENIEVAEDNYVRPYMGTIIKFIRIICFFFATLLPALYISMQTFHHEMIPTILLIKMAKARSGIPLPTTIETILMVFFYEILREAGTRLPKVIGSSVSIVGALVLGESAVNAGLVSSSIVIVVALTAISTFAIPPLTETIIILRSIFIISASVLGLVGVSCFGFIVVVHLVSLKSFGEDYTLPLAPHFFKNTKNNLWILPSKRNRLS